MRMTATINEAKVVESKSLSRAGQNKLVLQFDNGERVMVVVGTDPKDKSEKKDWLSVHSLPNKDWNEE